ncbi:Diaminopimelate decarboxylase [Streptoalloteichus tenebrarius]|uniref:Diaminopimelate decarboxylase n=1 Tax=Streptoalloteichus tenebrarius (strain ATCC 17920 / DSM 40477 / JCM 4838 / CBS 697.72 / NBRC 16177 / NCIMB 11028 / NRRL B-12390 / A12253. 1 / ISP 5477) TaxID=1933 RepID=A0ABT1HWA0_STRSD|nr:hypothetical protein [Streptoalloteichus tenebrarius]MCP2259795.1 Diaminopimelate decarboxylase [Streptoalloteichus tenebrarius]BFE99259.1 hypothetical protein GCM10020241_09350 [Streptoalloteichus tenebrarius]
MFSIGSSEQQRFQDIRLCLERDVVPRLGEIRTPALLYLDAVLHANVDEYLDFLAPLQVDLLYSVKPCTLDFVVTQLAGRTAGFDACTTAEARLVREILGPGAKPVHLTGLGVSQQTWPEVAAVADYVNVNSLSTLDRVRSVHKGLKPRVGLRVNPKFSTAKDLRYDPARPGSKLGVPPGLFERWVVEDGGRGVSGLHFHIACESSSLGAVVSSLDWLTTVAAPLLPRLEYLNVGGGWLRPGVVDGREDFAEMTRGVRALGVPTILTEPGTGVVRDAGVLATRVLDVIDTDDVTVAVVDTTVGHAPEVFEYAWAPEVHAPGNEPSPESGREYEIAGCSPLAGDVFGRYRFRDPLRVGQPLFFLQLGAYAQARWSSFTGLPWPSVHRLTRTGELLTAQGSSDLAYRSLWRSHGQR